MARATDEDRRALVNLGKRWGLPCDPEQASGLLAYAELLLDWGARINLTGARSVTVLLQDHFPDAFALARRLTGPASVVDIGTGGGLPALPLALLRPALTVDLCEPTGKKGAFLRTAIRQLGLSERVKLHATRGEALADSHGGQFDVAISRATFAPAAWLQLGRRLVRPGGRVFALAAPGDVPAGLDRELYLGDRRALVEVTVPRGTAATPGAD